MNRIAVLFEGNVLADRGKVSVFRSKAQAYAFLEKRVGTGWSRSYEVRTIWQPGRIACPPSKQDGGENG